ncbi:MAG TPA: HD domain-containing phosphohydrolase [Sulfuricella sp.]|nr:HD domain-containing phosphohydrolase [Sulfuricella sp.]
MGKPFAGQKEYFDAVIRTAQYVAGLTSDRDIWTELGKVITRFFGADLVAFAGRRPDGRIVIHSCSAADESLCPGLAGTAEEIIDQVLESGFLASETLKLPQPCSIAFLPLAEGRRTATVMLVGHRSAESLPRNLLNVYLAVAGLFDTTLARIASERRFLSMADNVPEMLYQMLRYPGGKARFTYVSKGSREVLGLPPDELLADATVFGGAFHAEDREAYETALARCEAGGMRLNQAFRWIGRAGECRHILLNAMPVMQEDGSVVWDGAAQDITERERIEEERKRNLLKLGKSLEETVQAIAATIEMRDPYTAGHQRRVAALARRIAEEMHLPSEEIHGIYLTATIHDIGKIHIPAEILSFPGKLGEIEYALIKVHAQAGYEILKNVEFPWPVAQMVYQHHEHLDGSGYPRGLKGDEIMLGARIVCVADVVESMASYRPYRPGLGVRKALAEIRKNRGKLYDAAAVGACLKLFKEGYEFE